MLYHVARGGQTYGPYTLEDLTRYVASGNILPTDMARAEGSEQWLPVAQLVAGPSAAPPAPPPYRSESVFGVPLPGPYPPMPAGTQPIDSPPNLHWGLVLLFSALTCTFFMYVWNLILAMWANRIAPASRILIFYIVATVLAFTQAVVGFRVHINFNVGDTIFRYPYHTPPYTLTYLLLCLVCWIARLIARFTMRNTLQQHYNTVEPIGLRLSGVMTFFFGGLYFQYHLNRINEMKRTMAYGAGRL